jgi:hypothetical protein
MCHRIVIFAWQNTPTYSFSLTFNISSFLNHASFSVSVTTIVLVFFSRQLSFTQVLSAYQEKIPARNEICAHAQDFTASDELLLATLKAFIPPPLNKHQDNRLSCVLMNSMWFNVEHYHNTHSTQCRCTHYTLLSNARCFQSVCSSVTTWCVMLFFTNSSPLVHPPVNFPPKPQPPSYAGTFSWNADCSYLDFEIQSEHNKPSFTHTQSSNSVTLRDLYPSAQHDCDTGVKSWRMTSQICPWPKLKKNRILLKISTTTALYCHFQSAFIPNCRRLNVWGVCNFWTD